jgi:hypothetical protein
MNIRTLSLALALVATASFVACDSDDGGTGPAENDELVGTWLSTGTDVAPGLMATLKTKSITAVFSANNTYNVVATDSSNAAVTFTGTWAATGTEGAVRAITLNQATPTSLTSQGIFQIVGTRLTYEVIQTQPAIAGFAAPTVAGGFGSTSYNGVPLGATWTQKFSKQ